MKKSLLLSNLWQETLAFQFGFQSLFSSGRLYQILLESYNRAWKRPVKTQKINALPSTHPPAISFPLPIFTILPDRSPSNHHSSALLPFRHSVFSGIPSFHLPPSPVSLPWPIFSFLIWPSSLSLHPIRFSPARLPRWASLAFFYVGQFNKVELHSWDACYIWSTFQPVCCEAQHSSTAALQAPARMLGVIQECLAINNHNLCLQPCKIKNSELASELRPVSGSHLLVHASCWSSICSGFKRARVLIKWTPWSMF